jgi:GTP diphosphokinase / guanosine-3',5'-bis(diphosphate) 3'-diphosphatase
MNLEKLFGVYEFAKKAHESINQKRETGEDYITHPIAVAQIANKYGADEQTIYACLLHDVVEDTPITLKQISNLFGKEIAFLVDGVTKINHSPETTYKKIEQYSEKDKRVIQIKLADRIHNTLNITPRIRDKYKTKSNPHYILLGNYFGYDKLAKKLEEINNKI